MTAPAEKWGSQECPCRVSGRSYEVSSPWQGIERYRSVILYGECYFRRLPNL